MGMVRKNKRGWVRIIEAFFAVLLILGVLLIMISKNYFGFSDSQKIYEVENAILQNIELNQSLRQNILEAEGLPVEWADFESQGLTGVKEKITDRTPNYLTCEAKLCGLDDECVMNQDLSGNIYTNSIGIYAVKDIYSPRKLKLFCWEK